MNCIICGKTFPEGVKLMEHEQACQQAKELEEKVAILRARANIPPIYANKTRKDWVGKWPIPETSKGVILGGRVGCGKTMLLSIVANEKLVKCESVLFISTPELLGRLRRNFSGEKYDDIMEQCKRVKHLMLDDLGRESDTSYANESMFLIVNHRYENNKPTYFTTNKSPEEMLQGEAIVSRIYSMCEAVDIKSTKDWRRQ